MQIFTNANICVIRKGERRLFKIGRERVKIRNSRHAAEEIKEIPE